MAADLNHVMTTVSALMTDEFPATVEGEAVSWRILDDPQADSQRREGYPLIEFEFNDANNQRDEYGAPGCNRWSERSAFMVHVHVARSNQSLALARSVMSEVINVICGRQIGSVQFRDALAAFTDSEGSGLTRGVSRSIKYDYDYKGR